MFYNKKYVGYLSKLFYVKKFLVIILDIFLSSVKLFKHFFFTKFEIFFVLIEYLHNVIRM